MNERHTSESVTRHLRKFVASVGMPYALASVDWLHRCSWRWKGKLQCRNCGRTLFISFFGQQLAHMCAGPVYCDIKIAFEKSQTHLYSKNEWTQFGFEDVQWPVVAAEGAKICRTCKSRVNFTSWYFDFIITPTLSSSKLSRTLNAVSNRNTQTRPERQWEWQLINLMDLIRCYIIMVSMSMAYIRCTHANQTCEFNPQPT